MESGGIFQPDSKETLANLGIELIQDDAIFNDVAVSMGTYGIITHLWIKLVDAFWVTEGMFDF